MNIGAMFFDNSSGVPVTTNVRNLSTSFVFSLPSRRGEQAVEVKGTPEALRQAMGSAKDGCAHTMLRHSGARRLSDLE